MAALVLALILAGATAGQPDSGARQEAEQLVQTAEAEIRRGAYGDAIEHARRAARLYGSLGDRAQEARALNRVGQAALYAGDYGEAARSFGAAVDRSRAAGDREGEAAQLGNLGNVHFFVGRYSDAAQTYDAALAIVTAAGRTPWADRRRRVLLVNKAALFQRLGQDQEALGIYTQLGGDAGLPAEEQGQLLVNRGVLYRRLGDPIKALETYEAARRVFSASRHVDGELGALKNRGIVLALDLQQLEAAERAFSDVLRLSEAAGDRRERLHGYLYRGESRLRSGRAADADADFRAALALARELNTPEEEWKALYGLGRSTPDATAALAHLETAVARIEQIREGIRIPSLRSDFFSDKTEVYDALIARRIGAASAGAAFALIERSHSRAWRDRLGLSGPLALQTVQQRLPPATLLLDYWVSSAGASVVAATRQRAAVFHVRVDDAAVGALDAALAASPPGDWRAPARALSAVLPPAEWFDGVTHVIVVPGGPLALVPFDLLAAGDRLLIERTAISYTPTAATLLRDSPPVHRRSPPWRLQIRAFADPLAGGGATAGTSRPTLAASRTEVTAIASEVAGRSALHLAGDNLKAHLLQADHPPLLHIASHAAASTISLEQSHITFSAPQGSSNPVDYLYLKEAYDLPLGAVELAVLSACDTERGPMIRGEGVQSFSRAFLASGAQTTVTTLWRVPDAPTSDFMRLFYHHLQRGESRATALRLAKLRFLQSGSRVSHPHYWAAFVLTGDGLRPISRAVPWKWGVATIGTVAIALFAGLAFLNRRGRGPNGSARPARG